MSQPKLATARSGVIYGLQDSQGIVRYVGQTRRSLATRLAGHRSEARRPRYSLEFHAWFNEEWPVAIVLEECAMEDLDSAEERWIAELSPQFNDSTGGAKGFTWTKGKHNPIANLPKDVRAEKNPFYGKNHDVETRRRLSGARNPMAKLTRPQVDEIIRRAQAGEVQKRLAEEFKVGEMTISRIVRGQRWGNGLS